MSRYISNITIISCLLYCIACDDNDPPSDDVDGPPYEEGETILKEHYAMEFDFCYPTCGASAPFAI